MLNKIAEKKVLIILIAIIFILVIILVLSILNYQKLEINVNNIETDSELSVDNKNQYVVLPTLLDEVKSNSVWCATFQLVWNDFKDKVVKNDIQYTPQKIIANNLNQETFIEKDLTEDNYYKIWGIKNSTIKNDIEKNLKEKYGEGSNILELIDWKNDNNETFFTYILFSMIKKEFNFNFEKLDNGIFAKTYQDIQYFGIQNSIDLDLYNQVNVYYYVDDTDFAVGLKTSQDDEVILLKKAEGNNFMEIFQNFNKKSLNYLGDKNFTYQDTLKIPNISINAIRKYDELEEGGFPLKNGEAGVIDGAIQSIKVIFNNSGEKIESDVKQEKQRNFSFDDEFVIFFKKINSENPYFASVISDITFFQ